MGLKASFFAVIEAFRCRLYGEAEADALAVGLGLSVPESGTMASVPPLLLLSLHAVAPNNIATLIAAVRRSVIDFFFLLVDSMSEFPFLYFEFLTFTEVKYPAGNKS
jgi:hypothetical protein